MCVCQAAVRYFVRPASRHHLPLSFASSSLLKYPLVLNGSAVVTPALHLFARTGRLFVQRHTVRHPSKMRQLRWARAGRAALPRFASNVRVLLPRDRNKDFIPVWLVAAMLNMREGISRAGCSVTEELPIFLLIFAIPAGVASFVWWKFS